MQDLAIVIRNEYVQLIETQGCLLELANVLAHALGRKHQNAQLQVYVNDSFKECFIQIDQDWRNSIPLSFLERPLFDTAALEPFPSESLLPFSAHSKQEKINFQGKVTFRKSKADHY